MLESNEPDFTATKQPTGLEESWPVRRINLLKGLYTSASYLADVAHDHGDVTTAEMAVDVMGKCLTIRHWTDRQSSKGGVE